MIVGAGGRSELKHPSTSTIRVRIIRTGGVGLRRLPQLAPVTVDNQRVASVRLALKKVAFVRLAPRKLALVSVVLSSVAPVRSARINKFRRGSCP